MQSGWPTTGSNPNMFTQYGANPSQYMQPQAPGNVSGFYPQQATGALQGGSPILARSQYHQHQQFQQQPNFHPIQQQPNYRAQSYQQQPYQQPYQQGYQQRPLQQQYQQFHQPQIAPFQQQSAQPPAQPLAQPLAQQPSQVDPAVARKQQEKMIRVAQKKKEFEEQKQKFRSMVIGAPVVNPVDALFGKPSSVVKTQSVKQVEEQPKDEQETKGTYTLLCLYLYSIHMQLYVTGTMRCICTLSISMVYMQSTK